MAAEATIWNVGAESDLRSMWNAGFSASQIAKRVGKSRNAVIGKAKRLTLSTSSPRAEVADYSLEDLRSLAERINGGESEIPVHCAMWPEDQWLELIGMIQALAQPEPANDEIAAVPTRGGFWRDGQAQFRKNVLGNYRHACCVTRTKELRTLEAAHIKAHAAGGSFDLANGLALRSDIHQLFDAGLIAIDPTTLRVTLSRSVRCSQYQQLAGIEIAEAVRAPPDLNALRWHRRHVFKA